MIQYVMIVCEICRNNIKYVMNRVLYPLRDIHAMKRKDGHIYFFLGGGGGGVVDFTNCSLRMYIFGKSYFCHQFFGGDFL